MTCTKGSVPLGRNRTRPCSPSRVSSSATADHTASAAANRSGSGTWTFTSTWGTRVTKPSSSSASGFFDLAIRSARFSPVRSPSPVVAIRRKMMCPDCSPPRANPSASRAARTWRSPTGVSFTVIPRCSMASLNPRLVMTVTTTVLPANWPRSARSTVNRATCSTTAVANVSVWVDPQPALILDPSGSHPMATTSAPTSSYRRAAISAAAPLAPSTTSRRPSSRRPSSSDTRWAREASAAPGSLTTRPTPKPSGLRGPRTPGSRTCSSSSSMAVSVSTDTLVPPRANSLMPSSAKGLCDAEITAPGMSRSADNQAMAGVGRIPTSMTSAPSPASPAERAAWSIGPERRVSRPTTKDVARSFRAVARPRARTSSGESSALATPRTPSVPNRARPIGLPLGILRCLAGLLQAVLLRFLLARVAGKEAGLLKRSPELGVHLDQRPGDAHTEGARLSGYAAAIDGDVDVPRLSRLGQPKRLGHQHAVGGRCEVLLELELIDGDGALARAEAHARHRSLASSGGLAEWGGVGHEMLLVVDSFYRPDELAITHRSGRTPFGVHPETPKARGTVLHADARGRCRP